MSPKSERPRNMAASVRGRLLYRLSLSRHRDRFVLKGAMLFAVWANAHQVRLVQLAKQGDIERETRGVYRFTRFPRSQLGHYTAAVLWPQVRRPDVVGVVSHQSAMSIHGLSDVNPARIHLTLPAAVRLRRQVPKVLVIHYAELEPDDVERVEGVPVTTPARSIRDAHASHLGSEIVGTTIADGRRSGALGLAEADALERELLGTTPRRRRVSARRRGAR
jgi:predicted transcriptional regulator of viral defense system